MSRVADRVAAANFGSPGRGPRSERGRAKAQAEGTIPEYDLQRLRLALVAPCPMNPRRNYGTDEQKTVLGLSLAKKQTTACVAVTREAYLKLWPSHEQLIDAAAEHVLLNGERRYRSARHVDLDALDFVIRDDLATSRADFVDYLMVENEEREDFDVVERARGSSNYSTHATATRPRWPDVGAGTGRGSAIRLRCSACRRPSRTGWPAGSSPNGTGDDWPAPTGTTPT